MLNFKPARLDRTRPFELVYSCECGLRLSQDGKLFMPNGKLVGAEDNEPPDNPVTMQTEQSATADTATNDVWHMHWTQLRALVETYGGVWTDKQAAIEFLGGK